MLRPVIVLAAVLALGACKREGAGDGADDSAPAGAAAGSANAPLPAPLGTPGQTVTGMPDAQPLPPAPAEGALAPVDAAEGSSSTPAIDPATGLPLPVPAPGEIVPAPAAAPGMPGVPAATATQQAPAAGDSADAAPIVPEQAADVVRQYHAEIDRGAFDRAYALWAEDGAASGQSAEAFASGLRDMVDISADVRAPARLRSGAGVLYIEVPVSVAVEYRDGRRRRLEGAYLLKRSTQPGATDEQRQWRISSALLREVTP